MSPENFAEADAAHIRAGRGSAAQPLRELVDLVLPELAREEVRIQYRKMQKISAAGTPARAAWRPPDGTPLVAPQALPKVQVSYLNVIARVGLG